MNNIDIDSLLDEKIERWKNKLINLGKRNNLISYRFTKSRSIEIKSPQLRDIIKVLSSNEEISFGKEDEENPQINKKNIWLSKENDKITEKKLKNLYLKYRENDRELGIETCFVALGMLEYKEIEYSDSVFYAPLFIYPVEVIRISKTSKRFHQHKIRVTSSPEFNPALKEKLVHDYGIELRDFDNDEDIFSYKNYFMDIISGKKDWRVIDSVYVDIFSYQKFIMYNEFIKYKDLIKKSLLIHSYVGDNNALNSLDEGIDIESFGDNFDDTKSLDVLQADSSQKKAIDFAVSGGTFVLQGPPGTGKSQTIVNIIANSIKNGKKVLFVSQKMAALDVVQKRLNEVGLGSYAINLHSFKGNKKDIVKELYNSLCYETELPYMANSDVSPEIYLKNQHEVNRYYDFLCEPRTSLNISLYYVMGKLAKLHEIKPLGFQFEEILKINSKQFNEIKESLNQIEQLSENVANNPVNPVFLSLKIVDSPYIEEQFKQYVKMTEDTILNLQGLLQDLQEKADIVVKSMSDLKNMLAVISKTKEIHLREFPEFLFTFQLQDVNTTITELYDALYSLENDRNKLLSDVQPSFLNLDTSKIEKNLKNGTLLNKIFDREYKESKKILQNHIKKNIKYIDLQALFQTKNHFDALSEETDLFLAKNAELIAKLKDYKDLPYLKMVLEKVNILLELKEWVNKLFGDDQYKFVKFIYFDKISHLNTLESTAKKLLQLIDEASNYFEPNIFSTVSSINLLKDYIDILKLEMDHLPFIIDIKNLYNTLPNEIKNFVQAYFSDNGRHAKSSLTLVFLKTYYEQVYSNILKEGTDISVRRVKILADELREREQIAQKITIQNFVKDIEERKPTIDFIGINNPEVGLLKRESEKKKRIKPFRKLLAEIPDLIFSLKPCFMMSPLTVSQYIDPNLIHFDVVIFDEASQIMPEDAVVCLLRANQAVVVGDSQQLPPTTFFMHDTSVYPDNENEEDIEDLDSFLKEASSKFREKELKWHYRSRSEDLIAFSNFSFYNNKLITFPNNSAEQDGLEFVYVENGIYDRGGSRKNINEACTVVEIYKREKEKHPDKSFGIVAFSFSQEEAIRDCMEKEGVVLNDSDKFISTSLFVKNLETVQGDERDIIILSIGYGHDSNGKFSYNFGPLNKEEGYKRLNVAITRARIKVIVVSSILPEEMDDTKIKSKSIKLLKNYLIYAKDKKLRGISTSPSQLQFDSPFEEAVYDSLVKEGFDVATQVGCSGYRIDLAIKDPDKPGRYILGIECDGAQYHSSRYARDRDVIRQRTLEDLGWRIHRIWSSDWIRNREREIEKIKEKVKNVEEEKTVRKREKIETKRTKRFDEEDLTEESLNYPKYRAVRINEIPFVLNFDRYGYTIGEERISRAIEQEIIKVLKAESPVDINFLYKRILKALGISRNSKNVRNLLSRILSNMEDKSIIYRIDATVSNYPIKQYYRFRISDNQERDVMSIPKEELAGLIIDIINRYSKNMKEQVDNITLLNARINSSNNTVSNIISMVSKITGTKRLTEKTKNKIKETLSYIAKNHLVNV